jgi:formamidopyrimidine-DNA glycosylase
MVFHLGMSGRWRIDPAELLPHDHLVLETAQHRLALNDPRRFGSVDLVPTAGLAEWPPFKALGPEPLGPGVRPAHLVKAFDGRIAPIKALLLDQRIVAGLGNIYVCEALMAGIAPMKPAGQVAKARLESWSRRSVKCWKLRSKPAAPRSRIMRGPTGNWAISPSSGGYMAAKASPALVAVR